MKNNFIPYEEAKELKELGFDGPCFGYYRPMKSWMMEGTNFNPEPHFHGPNWSSDDNTMHFMYVANSFGDRNSTFSNVFDESKGGYKNIAVPLWQQAFKWFRDKHYLSHIIFCDDGDIEYDNLTYNYEIRPITYSFKNIKKEMKSVVGDSLDCRTYEDAQLKCLRELIKIVKNDTKRSKTKRVR